MIYFCEGNDKEKLEWFKTINIAGERLTDQELRNAVYTGAWLTHAKTIFSKSNCAAYLLAKDYVAGSPIRQEILETALYWASRGNIENYMSIYQHKPNASDLWDYFQNVIEWIKKVFIIYRGEMKGINWGYLYENFKDKTYNPSELEKIIKQLMEDDDDVTNKKGIYSYVLMGDARHLNIRAFTPSQKRTAYERQNHACYDCKQGFDIKQMDGHHNKPWSMGGKTLTENCIMLCRECHRKRPVI